MPDVKGIRSSTVCRLAKMPSSTLNYWVQIGLVRPTYRGPTGRRIEYWWSIEDVVVVRSVRALRQAGATLSQVRRAASVLARWGQSFADTRVFWDGVDIVIAGSSGPPMSGHLRPGQQMFLLVGLPTGEWFIDASSHAEEIDLSLLRRERRQQRRRQTERTMPVESLLGETGG